MLRTRCSTSCVSSCASDSRSISSVLRAASTDGDVAYRIAVYKSGKYTVERPMHLGAALADRLGTLAPTLTAVGLPLGQAFQLRDDLLGAFGDAETIGKPVGDDLREGKATPLVAIAATRTTEAERPLLARLGAADLDLDEISALRELFVRCGAVDEIEAAIARLVAEARDALAAAPLTADARSWLDDLAGYVAWRDR